MITEEAVPLQVSLEDDSGKSDYTISWGIHQILVSHYICVCTWCVCTCVRVYMCERAHVYVGVHACTCVWNFINNLFHLLVICILESHFVSQQRLWAGSQKSLSVVCVCGRCRGVETRRYGICVAVFRRFSTSAQATPRPQQV